MLIKFPKHSCSLSLEHNPHKNNYQTVEAYCEFFCADPEYWISEENYKKACETDELWILQWYPDTPIGSYTVCADNLQDLLNYVNENYPDD